MNVLKLRKAAATLAACAFVFSATHQALAGDKRPSGQRSPILTINSTDKRVWVTIYGEMRTSQQDWGWVGPHSKRLWASGIYHTMGSYPVRGEVKDPNDRSGNPRTVFDTSITLRHSACGEQAADAVDIVQGGPNQYYWKATGCQPR